LPKQAELKGLKMTTDDDHLKALKQARDYLSQVENRMAEIETKLGIEEESESRLRRMEAEVAKERRRRIILTVIVSASIAAVVALLIIFFK
jgi:predicted anti-sigma-YlaC factor YlaD